MTFGLLTRWTGWRFRSKNAPEYSEMERLPPRALHAILVHIGKACGKLRQERILYNLFVIGQSHVSALLRFFIDAKGAPRLERLKELNIASISVLPVLKAELTPYWDGNGKLNSRLAEECAIWADGNSEVDSEICRKIGEYAHGARDICISLIGGNSYNLVGILERQFEELSDESGEVWKECNDVAASSTIKKKIADRSADHLGLLRHVARIMSCPCYVVAPLAPNRCSERISTLLPASLARGESAPQVSPPWFRSGTRIAEKTLLRETADEIGATFVDVDSKAASEGFLTEEFLLPNDAIHANANYGELLVKAVIEMDKAAIKNPYRGLPDKAYWRRTVANKPAEELDPVSDFPMKIQHGDKIVTAGSCFAQEIAKSLQAAGYDYHVTETAPLDLPREEARIEQYGVYSARYGNVYTVRQLLQLFDRAFQFFRPIEPFWRHGNRFVDAFRPTIPQNGFADLADAKAAQEMHFDAVRRAFTEADVFVFTLGLTEAFEDLRDGSVYPVCPGVNGGEFNPKIHKFHNFTTEEIVADFSSFMKKFGHVNPNAQVIVTVSPVPLIATASGKNVVEATTYSKSVLRVAAQKIQEQHDNVHYFPSYEIIAGSQSGRIYFEDDLRSVSREGVAHVMRVFFKHAVDASSQVNASQKRSADQDVEYALNVICEEELLDSQGS